MNVNWSIDGTSWLSSGWVSFCKETAPAGMDILSYTYMQLLNYVSTNTSLNCTMLKRMTHTMKTNIHDASRSTIIHWAYLHATTHIIISTKSITPNSGLLPFPTSFTSTDGCTIGNDVGLEVKLFLGLHTIGAISCQVPTCQAILDSW